MKKLTYTLLFVLAVVALVFGACVPYISNPREMLGMLCLFIFFFSCFGMFFVEIKEPLIKAISGIMRYFKERKNINEAN